MSVTNPKGAVQKREYDPVGRVVRVLDFDGNDIRLSYDGIDNLTEYRDNVQHVEYGYSGMWKLTRRRDHRGVVNFRYDRGGTPAPCDKREAPATSSSSTLWATSPPRKASTGPSVITCVTGADASSGRRCRRERKGNTAMTPARA